MRLLYSTQQSWWVSGGCGGGDGSGGLYIGITLSVCPSLRLVCMGRRLLIFSNVTFKMADWWPYWIFMPPSLGARGIMFSGCPSIYLSISLSLHPSKAQNTLFSTCTWVCRSIHPTNRDHFVTYLSVRPSGDFQAFAGECIEGMALKFCMLIYLGHLQNWLDYGHSLLIFLLLVPLWLSEMGQIWGFRAFLGECIKGMAWNLHADVSWPPSELVSLWSGSVDFSDFGTTFT